MIVRNRVIEFSDVEDMLDEIARLRAALQPFADVSRQYPRLEPDTIIATITDMALTLPGGDYLTFEVFRKAEKELTDEL